MATFEKGILGGFSGKVDNVVGARWRCKDILRSVPVRGAYTPTYDQLQQQEKVCLSSNHKALRMQVNAVQI